MKKLFSILIAIALVFTLAACEEEADSEVEALQTRITDVEEENQALRASVDDLESAVADVEAALNEEGIIFTTATEASTEAITVPFNEEGDKPLIDLLDYAYDIEYTESDFGIFLNKVGSIEPTAGNFIQISKNGEAMDVGISDATFTGGDHFHFELSWWDDTLKSLDGSLDLFMDNQASEFSENNQVVLGLTHINHQDDYTIDLPEVGSDDGAGTLINHIFVKHAQDEDVKTLQDDLDAVAGTEYIYSAALSYLALSLNGEAYTQFEDDLKAELDTFDVSDSGNDTLGMVLMALSVMEDNAYGDLETSIVDHLKANAYNNEYGDNAATFAQITLGLLAVGEDPRDDAYVENDMNLIEHLLDYQDENGAFKYMLDDDSPDLDFSTPQAFFALAAYQASLNDESFTHPYRIN